MSIIVIFANSIQGDLSLLSQVRNIVKEFQAREQKVDCLVCNAGLLFNERKENSEGNELTFGCHLLGGGFLLSNLLIPQLKAAGPQARTIFISSGGMYNSKFPSWEQATHQGKYKEKYDGQMAYVYAKRGQVCHIIFSWSVFNGSLLMSHFENIVIQYLLIVSRFQTN